MSWDGPYMYHNDKRDMRTVEVVKSESGLLFIITEKGIYYNGENEI